MPSSYETHSYLQSFTTRLSNDSIQGLAGASAGVASSIVTCPLDVIKVNLQGRGGLQLWTLDSIHVQRAFQDRGLIGTGRLIWRERGLSGMYRGLGPTILTYLPRWSVYFIVYHKSDEALRRTFGLPKTWLPACVSATSAGLCSTILTNPLWVVKTRMMYQSHVSGNYKSALEIVRKIYYNEGISSFYSGLTPALLGVSHLAIQFPLYEQIKKSLTGTGLGCWDEEGTLQVPGILVASSLSKMCAGAATYPHEVIRTRLQTQRRTDLPDSLGGKPGHVPHSIRLRGDSSSRRGLGGTPPLRYRGVISTSKTILREEGWRALYAGMGTSMTRAIPASITTMLVYETMVQLLKKSRADGERKLERLGQS